MSVDEKQMYLVGFGWSPTEFMKNKKLAEKMERQGRLTIRPNKEGLKISLMYRYKHSVKPKFKKLYASIKGLFIKKKKITTNQFQVDDGAPRVPIYEFKVPDPVVGKIVEIHGELYKCVDCKTFNGNDTFQWKKVKRL